MKKFIITSLFILLGLFGFSQKYQSIKQVNMATDVSPINVLVGGDISLIDVYGTKTLTGNYAIQASGVPSHNTSFTVFYHAPVTLDGNTLNIFGANLTEKQARDTLIIISYYIDGVWKPVILQSVASQGWIYPKMFSSDVVDGVTVEIDPALGLQVKDGSIVAAKLESLAAGQFFIGNAGGVTVKSTISGDIVIGGGGAAVVQNDAITTVKILDENITVGKMADLAQGSVLVGGALNRPVALDVNDNTKILIGDGTDLGSVLVSGDATITNAGVLTVANDAITTAKILNANITLAKMEALVSAKVWVGDGSNRPAAVLMSGDATITNAGVVTIAASSVENSMLAGSITTSKLTTYEEAVGKTVGFLCVKLINSTQLKALLDGGVNNLFTLQIGETLVFIQLAVQTASGVAGTVDVGADANIRSAGQDIDAFLDAGNANVAGFYHSNDDGTYRGALLDFGFWPADGTGNILIQSSANFSASAFVGTIAIYYTPKN